MKNGNVTATFFGKRCRAQKKGWENQIRKVLSDMKVQLDGEFCQKFRLSNDEVLVLASPSLLWIPPLQCYEKGLGIFFYTIILLPPY